MEKHITVVAALRIGFGVLGIIPATVVFLAAVIVAVSTAGPADVPGLATNQEPVAIVVLVAVASFLTLLALPGIIGGIGLLQGKAWARILVLILSLLDLINVPFGTIIGSYTLWVLLQDETARSFQSTQMV